MRRLKIMTDDGPTACGNVFGVKNMLDRLNGFYREQGAEMPFAKYTFKIEVQSYRGQVSSLEGKWSWFPAGGVEDAPGA